MVIHRGALPAGPEVVHADRERNRQPNRRPQAVTPQPSLKAKHVVGGNPKPATLSALVETATKCLATAASSFAAAKTTHGPCWRAWFLAVNVFDATTKRVSQIQLEERLGDVRAVYVRHKNCTVAFRVGFKASVTMTGPKSEPPMPMLTTVL